MTSTGYIQVFRVALASDWLLALECDEWFFSRVVNDIATRLSSIEAFAAIDEVAELLLLQSEPTLKYYCGVLLINLARRSDTTELPCGLWRDWDTIEQLLHDYSDIVNQLRRWCRQ